MKGTLMKQFNSTSMVVFDSTIAHFKLSIEAKFAKKTETGDYRSKVYIKSVKDRAGNFLFNIANLNPDIYLVLAYKSDTFDGTQKGVIYTSYPQLYKLRSALEEIKNLVENNKGFGTVDGKLIVKPDYSEPVIIADIGQGKQSLSFKLRVIQIDGTEGDFPAVSIQIADADSPCVLSVDEFFTIYTIINDLDLTQQQTILSALYLLGEPMQQRQPYQQQPYQEQGNQYWQQQIQRPGPDPYHYMAPGTMPYQQPVQPQTTPQYGSNGYHYSTKSPSNGRYIPPTGTSVPAQQQRQPVQQVHKEEEINNNSNDAPEFVESSYDDAEEIAQIFKNNSED